MFLIFGQKKMVFIYILFGITIAADCLNQNWPYTVSDFFVEKNINSFNIYTCSRQDSLVALKTFRNDPDIQFSVKSQPIIDELPSRKHYTLGIFVDLSCTQNREKFESISVSGVFNTTYIWLVFAEDSDEIINNSVLGPSSDVTLLNSQNVFFHLRRSRPDLNIAKIHLGRWLYNRPLHLKATPSVRHLNNATITFSTYSPKDLYDIDKLGEQMANVNYCNGKDVPNRFIYSLHLIIAQMFNYNLELKIADDWGSLQPNGLYNGQLGMLQTGEADVTGELITLSYRLDVADPLITIVDWWAPFAFVQPKLVGTRRALYLQLKPLVWICLGLIIILGSIVFFITQNSKTRLIRNDTNYTSGLVQMISVISLQGLMVEPEKCSSRIVCLFMLLISTMVAIFYNAATMNALLSANPPSIRTLDGLLKSNLKLALADKPYFNNKEVRNRVLDDEVITKVDSLPKAYYTFDEGLQMILNGDAFAAEFFWLFDALEKRFDDSVKCGLTIINTHRPAPATSFIVKDSPHREMFMQGILRTKEHGMYNREYLRWIPSKPKCVSKQEFLFVKLEAVSVAFSIWISGFTASLAVLVWEILKFSYFSSHNSVIQVAPMTRT